MEGENKVLRKQCNEYVEETRQLRERSTSFFKSEHPSSEYEYLTRTIENMKRDYDRLRERFQHVEEESETHWRRAEENKRKYDEAFQKMRNLKNSFSEERQMLEREKERVVIENHWLNEELDKAKSRAAQPKRAIFSTTDDLSLLIGIGSGSAHMVSGRVISGNSRVSSGYGSAALKDLEVILIVYDHFFQFIAGKENKT